MPREQFAVGLSIAVACLTFSSSSMAQSPTVGKVQQLAPDVYFYEGDISKGHCNNGWIIFQDFVLVIDANFPSGAREVIAKIRELTKKPIRFAFDTHHHGDHAYGNQVWVDEGATAVAHTGVLDEMKRLETGQFGGAPGRWEDTAKEREDVRASKLKPPTVLFPDMLIFDDGTHRVELHHFGTGHTKGDGIAWLPKERIVFAGDAVVNGPYNFMGDGDSAAWVETLSKVAALGAVTVGPGHGPLGQASVITDQQTLFRELRRVVQAASTQTAVAVQAAIPSMREELMKNASIARYVGEGFPGQVGKVYTELTGRTLPDRRAELDAEQTHVAWHHGHAHVPGQ
jgi:cyclase